MFALNLKITQMKYNEFLFAQLFMNHIEYNKTEYEDLSYDIMYPEVLKHKKSFEISNFNVDILSEYECIINYLNNNIK